MNPYLDPHTLSISSGENLPHWQCNCAIYHISFRLFDSVPQSMREYWLREREYYVVMAKHSEKLKAEAEKQAHYLYSQRIEKYLDAGYGKCYLREEGIANMIKDTLNHFNNKRYYLHAWVIMPNHVHVIVETIPQYGLAEIVHSWKSYSAHRANKILGLKGAFWQQDYYNHIIRSEKEYAFQVNYTWENPDKAGFNNWKWRWKISEGCSKAEDGLAT